MKETAKKGFIIITNENGIILENRKDDFNFLEKGISILEKLDPPSIPKALTFLMELKRTGSGMGWEVNLNVNGRYLSVYLAGLLDTEKYIIIASTDSGETRKIFEELAIISNKQNNQLRKAVKESMKSKANLNQSDWVLNEVTKLNNEMTNMQRELSKKNVELKHLNQSLEIKNKELDQFAHIVSHDLKAPLKGISTLIHIIGQQYADGFDDELNGMFQLIQKRADRMDELISGILSYSRIGKESKDISTFKLEELLEEVLDSLAIPESFRVVLPESLPTLSTQKVQLSQVLSNLIGNAVKYHHENKGQIELQLKERADGFFHFSIKDDGPGIPEKYHKKIFGLFQSSSQESTGVGLAIVKKMVENNGGQIGIISELGKGSTFWFTWPRKE